MDTRDFYDRMSDFYHLIFWQGFDTSIQKHGEILGRIIRKEWGDRVKSILDDVFYQPVLIGTRCAK